MGLFYLGQTVDFLTILFTGKNLHPVHLYSILSYMWIPPPLIISMYVGSELITPKNKWFIITVYAVLGIMMNDFQNGSNVMLHGGKP